MVISPRFRSFIIFVLSPSYYDVLFIVDLLRRDVFRHLVTTLYLCGGNSNRQSKFDQPKISDYDRQYVEELELLIL